MCGFAGIVHFDPRQHVEVDRLRRMRDVLSHRGPDGSGLFVDGFAGLSHRRLAIVDVSTAGEQPMTQRGRQRRGLPSTAKSTTTRCCVPASRRRGHRYRSRCDTETIIHRTRKTAIASSRSCTACLPSRSGTTTSRSCCWRATGWASSRSTTHARTASCVFGSEIKSLFASGCLRATFNEAVLPEFLSTRFVSGDGHVFPRCPQAAAGPRADMVGGERDSHAALLAAAGAVRRAERRSIRGPGRRSSGDGSKRRSRAI